MEELHEKNKCKIYMAQMIILFMLIIGSAVMLVLDPDNDTYYISLISLFVGVLIPNPDHNVVRV